MITFWLKYLYILGEYKKIFFHVNQHGRCPQFFLHAKIINLVKYKHCDPWVRPDPFWPGSGLVTFSNLKKQPSATSQPSFFSKWLQKIKEWPCLSTSRRLCFDPWPYLSVKRFFVTRLTRPGSGLGPQWVQVFLNFNHRQTTH